MGGAHYFVFRQGGGRICNIAAFYPKKRHVYIITTGHCTPTHHTLDAVCLAFVCVRLHSSACVCVRLRVSVCVWVHLRASAYVGVHLLAFHRKV